MDWCSELLANERSVWKKRLVECGRGKDRERKLGLAVPRGGSSRPGRAPSAGSITFVAPHFAPLATTIAIYEYFIPTGGICKRRI
jgi:hypothetical protein